MSQISRRTFSTGLVVGAVAGAIPGLVHAAIPDRPIRLVVPWQAGGSTDVYCRGFAAILEKHLNRTIVVENRPGASGSVGLAYVGTQPADGSVIAGITDAAIRTSIVQEVQYDAREDFDYLGTTTKLEFGWVVAKDSPYKDLRELIAAAKQNPGKIRMVASGTPRNPTLPLVLLERLADVKFLTVSFTTGEINALMSGQVDVMGDVLGASAGLVASGDLRLLAVTSAERLPGWPDVPTAREQGIDIVYDLPIGFVIPKGAPADVIGEYDAAIEKAANDPEHDVLLKRLTQSKFVQGSEESEARINKYFETLPPIYRDLGIPINQT